MSWPLRTYVAGLVALLGAGAAFAEKPLPVTPSALVQADDERRFHDAVAKLLPQRPRVVDAYVVVAALDADPVFNREAREAGRVLARRFDAEGRTLVLAHDENSDKADVAATPERLARALDGVAA